MGIIRRPNGVFYARKFVPEELRSEVARLLPGGKDTVSWLTRSLRTKDASQANVRAKPVLMEFDRLLASARTAVACEPAPMRTDLSESEIELMADYHYASQLQEDEDVRRDTLGSDALYSEVARDLRERGVTVQTPFEGSSRPRYGLSPREFRKVGEALGVSLEALQTAYSKGDVSWVEDELDELFAVFRLRLAPQSKAYRQLGMAVLARSIEATEGALKRHRGQPVATPILFEPHGEAAVVEGSTLSAAVEGWRRATTPAQGTATEFGHAVKRFVELHGDMPVPRITKRHIRQYREALQCIPLRRVGELRGATLPALLEWKNKHPDAPTISNGTATSCSGEWELL